MARNGLLFAAILSVSSLLGAMFSIGVDRAVLPPEAGDGAGPVVDAPPISLGLSPIVAGVLSLALALVSLVVLIGGIRTFVSEETETLPRKHFATDIPWTAVNLVVGSILFGIAVGLGFVLLIVPGLFLLVSLFFWQVVVAVEDENFVDGFRRSWALTGGRRLRLFALGLVVALVGLVVSVVFAIPGVVLPAAVGLLIEQVGSALLGVFFLATAAETYNRLLDVESDASHDSL